MLRKKRSCDGNKAVYMSLSVAYGWVGAVAQNRPTDQPTNQWMDRRTDGPMDGRTDGRTDGWTDGRTDGQTLI